MSAAAPFEVYHSTGAAKWPARTDLNFQVSAYEPDRHVSISTESEGISRGGMRAVATQPATRT
ncbi:hypothetical protein AAur_1943 [Paenarthrobacter aurescens TC1]|uniref:Uncharacterized protein n=1 Tax=Paenarthrobacter aurescens (strain TC1) TaxID=290340 RepID=A1R626_PAEAT|nr:hypothetical protein AAur_1943 [Paenarthrobacter aurescens TC1]